MPDDFKDRVKIRKRFFLCVDEIPMGEMYNMGQGGKNGLSFPHDALGPKKTIEEAKEAKAKMLRYISDIQTVPAKNRAGSAKRWGG